MYLDKFQPKVKGRRLTLISEAWQIPVREDAYDFLVSSHTLEHCPDTLRTLYEWKRVLRHEGVLFLVLPHGERTFDKGRQLTTLSHHIEDWEKQVGYDDSTHWMEFEKYSIPQYEHHWLSEARQGDGSIDFEYVVRNGHMHYHVWTQMEIVDVLKYIGCKIMVVDEELQGRRDSFLVIGSVGKK
jgi:SAM-dependent methyltransferase